MNLAEHGIRLEKGKQYQWSVALVYDPEHRSKDVVAMGGIERVAPSAEISEELLMAQTERVPDIYTEAGIWYDAVMAILPNVPDERVPAGGEEDNIVAREVGEKPSLLTLVGSLQQPNIEPASLTCGWTRRRSRRNIWKPGFQRFWKAVRPRG